VGTGSPVAKASATFGYKRREIEGRPDCVLAEYISLTQPDMDYLARVIRVVQQQLRDCIIALPDSCHVTSSLISMSYFEPAPDASKTIEYPHLYEELMTFV